VWPRRATILTDDGKPKVHRHYLIGSGKTFGVFLHHFVGSDEPDVLHDHPWNWGVALVVRGGYFEDRCQRPGSERARRWLGPGRLNVLQPGVFHRVELRDSRAAWTLFVHGRKTRRWGFLDLVTGLFRYWSPADPRYV
jgi:hypothetical protein